jgi:spore protease
VLGTSGIESAEQIRNLCEAVKPELVVVIDALAGSDADTLCRSVQVSNAGISPGSGVGNDRKELSKRTLGVPVISIGIPTVIDAGFFGDEKLKGMFVTPKDIDSLVRAGGRLIGYAVNVAMHNGISIEEIDSLLG